MKESKINRDQIIKVRIYKKNKMFKIIIRLMMKDHKNNNLLILIRVVVVVKKTN